jgi:hypothetical protein
LAFKILLIGLFLPFLSLFSYRDNSKDHYSLEAFQSKTVSSLSLHFTQPTHSFTPDESFEIEAILKNEGAQTILVCRDIKIGPGNSQPCAWEFSVRDAAGGYLPGPGCQSAADGGVPLKKEDFPAVLIKNWIALSPGYSYGTRINLKNAFCRRPRPGRYQVIGVLTSSGLDGQSINNETAFYPQEIQKLPYPGWKGTIGSNKIWITVDGANRTH